MNNVCRKRYFATLLFSFITIAGCSGGGESTLAATTVEDPVVTEPSDTAGGDTTGGDTTGGDTTGGDTDSTNSGGTNSIPIAGRGATGLSPLGANLISVNDFTQSVPFIDLMLSARPFTAQTWSDIDDVEYDNQGWPVRLNGDRALTVAHMSLPQQQSYRGDYAVLYDGVGRLEYESAATLKSREPGRDVISFNPININEAIFLYIAETDEQNPIRNIKIIMPGGICADDMFVRVNTAEQCTDSAFLSFEENHERILFNPDFLSYARNFNSLRFMDWSKVIDSQQTSWSENRRLDEYTWSSFGTNEGVPIEVMISLSNLTGVNPWFTIPHLATDDYVRRLASYVQASLASGLKPYIEYSNEVWNPEYAQNQYSSNMGLQLGLDENAWAATHKYYARRSVEIFKIWEDVYGGVDQFTRVLSTQFVSSFMSNLMLEFDDAYKNVDALAVGPYFGVYAVDPLAFQTVDDVFTGIDDSRALWLEWLNAQVEITERYSVDLISYEGGQHLVSPDNERLTELYIAANRDPRMGAQYTWHLDRWREAGGKHFAIYTSPNTYNRFGSFGLKEYITQPRSEAPKYDALLNWIDANPVWW